MTGKACDQWQTRAYSTGDSTQARRPVLGHPPVSCALVCCWSQALLCCWSQAVSSSSTPEKHDNFPLAVCIEPPCACLCFIGGILELAGTNAAHCARVLEGGGAAHSSSKLSSTC